MRTPFREWVMDKPEFIEKAPTYYALGIALALRSGSGARTIQELDESFERSNYRYFQKERLVDQALKILLDSDVLEIIEDDFGPPLYKETSKLPAWMRDEAGTDYPV